MRQLHGRTVPARLLCAPPPCGTAVAGRGCRQPPPTCRCILVEAGMPASRAATQYARSCVVRGEGWRAGSAGSRQPHLSTCIEWPAAAAHPSAARPRARTAHEALGCGALMSEPAACCHHNIASGPSIAARVPRRTGPSAKAVAGTPHVYQHAGQAPKTVRLTEETCCDHTAAWNAAILARPRE